jgi:hypothetical protein
MMSLLYHRAAISQKEPMMKLIADAAHEAAVITPDGAEC